jgi:GNAT superfamily N-acetyltransferase
VELLINPPLDEVRPVLLESLNRCFPNWGHEDEFQWHLVRTVGGRKTDVMLVREQHGFVAGSAIVYRPVRLRTGQTAEVGIMASSWTLPEARGHGHFSRIIETSVQLARDNGVALLMAYVTSINASARRLLASGATAFPTHYLIGDGAPPMSTGPMPAVMEERATDGDAEGGHGCAAAPAGPRSIRVHADRMARTVLDAPGRGEGSSGRDRRHGVGRNQE